MLPPSYFRCPGTAIGAFHPPFLSLVMSLRYPLLALALVLAAPAALADPCESTDADDVLQATGGRAYLFGTSESGATQEFGQSFTASCDGTLDFFRVLYRARDMSSAGVVISGNALFFEGATPTGTPLETVPFTFTLGATMDQRALDIVASDVPVTEGASYTIFLDITSGAQAADLFASTEDVYSGGDSFVSTDGSVSGAVSSDTFDLVFRARFKPSSVASEAVASRGSVALLPTRPNPAAGRTRVPFTLDRPADVRLAVYDALGREVALVAERAYGAGAHAEVLDTAALAPGTYVVRLVAGPDVVLRTIAVAR